MIVALLDVALYPSVVVTLPLVMTQVRFALLGSVIVGNWIVIGTEIETETGIETGTEIATGMVPLIVRVVRT